MYKNGYKSRLIEERSDSYLIDLYPEDIKSDLIRVRLSIGKSLMDLKSLEYKKRDGVIITLAVKDYNLKTKPDPGLISRLLRKNIRRLKLLICARISFRIGYPYMVNVCKHFNENFFNFRDVFECKWYF